ncbi:hypothetical protein QQS21_007685 [Conoideocrella luteorostrata]|uniref:Allergen Asp f 4 n=1 Tax=Conoideocrella luteorostrata TaxID=1105319 RepID=A0AAJ0FZ98_9HYPO|nr:hypothetical protein QQS21_007685 [Conoideocrella luteorostrata]
MKVSATTLILAAALGVSARPSGHGHMDVHRSMDKRMDFVMAKKPNAAPPAGGLKAAIAPSPTTSQAPPPPPPPPATSSAQFKPAPAPSSGSSGPKQFCGGNKKRATIADIAYKGNTGAPGNRGCNLMMVDNAADYDYTAIFENKSGKDQECVAFLKIGPTGKVNGFQQGNEIFKFNIPVGGKKVLAAEADTQGGVACGPGQVAVNQYGQWANTWLEFDFASSTNNRWSGADISCLVASDSNMPIQAMRVCERGTCSTINDGGSGINAYVAKTHALDGVGLNLPAGPVSLKVTVG